MPSVKNLDIILDSKLSMSQHISNTCKAVYIHILHIVIYDTFSPLKQLLKPLYALLSSLG